MKFVDSEEKLAELTAGLVLLKTKAQSTREVVISWKGSKSPHGVIYDGRVCGCAQHGMLRDEDDNDIGPYRRTKMFAGPDRDEHEMVVSLIDRRES